MATVPGPPTRLADVCAVFGAPLTTRLFDFGRGGPWVPDIAQNAGVPPYGQQIRLVQLAGATNYQPPVISGPSSRAWSGEGFRPPVDYTVGSAQTVSGNTNPYTAHWDKISGDAAITCTNPTVVGATFSCKGGLAGNPFTATAVWRLTVNDGVSNVTKDVTFTFTGLG